MAGVVLQKIPVAAAGAFSFVGGVVVAEGGTVGRAVFVALLFLFFLNPARLSMKARLLCGAMFAGGCVRTALPALAFPLPGSLPAALHAVHEALIRPFFRLFSPDEASLAAGLTVGLDTGFSAPLKAAMRGSGTTHLVALSGYNISLIIGNVLAFFTWFLPRRAAAWCAGTALVLFTLMAGAQPSLVRAACMGVLMLGAYNVGRRYHTPYALLYAAAGMLFFQPELLGGVGFQLSFVSLLGLVYIEPLLRLRGSEGHGTRRRISQLLGEQFRTTVAAQAAVLPLLLYYFGVVNVLSMPANVALLPVVPFAMLLALVTSLAGLYLPTLVFLPAFLLQVVLTYMLHIIYFFSRIVIPIRWSPRVVDVVLLAVAGVGMFWYIYATSSRQAARV